MFNMENQVELAIIRANDLKRTYSDEQIESLTFSLDVPPSINHMYHNTKGGGKRLTKVAEQYFFDVKAKVRAEALDQNWIFKLAPQWLYLDLYFYFPDRRRRDSHNCLKILLDALEGVLFENDYYVMPNIRLVEMDSKNPRVDVVLRVQTESERQQIIFDHGK